MFQKLASTPMCILRVLNGFSVFQKNNKLRVKSSVPRGEEPENDLIRTPYMHAWNSQMIKYDTGERGGGEEEDQRKREQREEGGLLYVPPVLLLAWKKISCRKTWL